MISFSNSRGNSASIDTHINTLAWLFTNSDFFSTELQSEGVLARHRKCAHCGARGRFTLYERFEGWSCNLQPVRYCAIQPLKTSAYKKNLPAVRQLAQCRSTCCAFRSKFILYLQFGVLVPWLALLVSENRKMHHNLRINSLHLTQKVRFPN